MESNWKTERDTILEQSNDSFTTFSAEGCVLCHLSISPEGTSYCMHFDTAENGVIMETTKDGIVKVSVISKGVEVERIDVSMIAHKQIVDMNVDGVRWEGDVFKDSPCGKGTMWDSFNHKLYEGFIFNGQYECYGTTFHSSLEKIEYQGGFCNNERHGRGTLFDRNGEVVYEGEWSNNCHDKITSNMVVTKTGPFDSLCSVVETLRFKTNCSSSLSSFSLHHLPRLQSAFFEGKAFFDKSMNGSFSVYSCPCLSSLLIKPNSFPNITSIVCYGTPSPTNSLSDLPALTELEFGDRFGYEARTITIRGLDLSTR